VHATHTSRIQSRGGSYISHEENTSSMQLEINRLRRRLCNEQQRRTPSDFGPSFDDDGDDSYKSRSKTPSSESFSCDEDRHYKRRSKSPSREGLSNDAISRALNQIFKSPFSTNPVEHVNHFNQRMVIHSPNEALMCIVFLSSLGHVAMRWFDGMKEGSISSFTELTRAFRARFVTCSRVPRPLDSLLSMTM